MVQQVTGDGPWSDGWMLEVCRLLTGAMGLEVKSYNESYGGIVLVVPGNTLVVYRDATHLKRLPAGDVITTREAADRATPEEMANLIHWEYLRWSNRR